MTIEQVAREAGISPTMLGYIEMGKRGRQLPVTTAKRIAAVLDFDWERFYEDEEGA